MKNSPAWAEGLDLPPTFLPGIPRVSGSACLAVLGSPVGGTAKCNEWADEHVGKPLALALDRLVSLGEPRSASLILRQCFSACKVNWILRTAEAPVGRALAEATAPLIRQAWEGILGVVGSDLSWELASLPIRLGGAGIASPLPICDAAVVSGWSGGGSSGLSAGPPYPSPRASKRRCKIWPVVRRLWAGRC